MKKSTQRLILKSALYDWMPDGAIRFLGWFRVKKIHFLKTPSTLFCTTEKSEANVKDCCGNLDISTNDDELMRYLNYEMIVGIG